MKEFDMWELPQCCVECGWIDGGSPKYPVTYLDGETKLCEDCFDEKYNKEDEIKNMPGCHKCSPCGACDDCLMFTK